MGDRRFYLVPLFCLVAALLLVSLNNCSVGMALSGKKTPELGAIRVGATRSDVELQLGPPIKSVTVDNKRVDVYEYEVGNDPSAGRAIGHGVLDVLTFGLWEVIGTPVEGLTGENYWVTVTYDANGRVVALDRETATLGEPSEKIATAVKKVTEQQTGTPTTFQKLKELQEMQKAGLISSQEYEIRKVKILDDFSSKK